jgi:hypothetical protein
MLVQSGTLRRGDVCWPVRFRACSRHARRERQADQRSRSVDSGRNPRPVGCAGCRRGSHRAADEKKAREIALFRQGKFRDVKLAKQQAAKLENMFEQMKEGEVKTLPLIVKADVQGSQEALVQTLPSCRTTKSGQRHPWCGRRDQRIRRQSGAGLRCGHHRLQHPCRCRCAQAGRDLRCRYPLLQRDLRRGRRGEGGACPACSRPRSASRSPGWSKSARSSTSPRSAPLPVATCSKVSSSAIRTGSSAAQQRCAVGRRTRFAQALQGRRQGSAQQLRMRPVAQEQQRYQLKAISLKFTKFRKWRVRCNEEKRFST